ncbi:MAG TPA: ScpA family protein [Micromonosporaceae bacterium]|nr:ScpA family protein [Micromonosporaceae bacterium]
MSHPEAAAATGVGRTGPDESGRDPATTDQATSGFQVRLTNFTGPFDLLLQLISKQKLEITELALSKVTDEFISYIRAMGDDWDLDEVSEFLVVAATLLDLKAAKLLPQAEVEDEEDLALLEARDLLFARLLQYKAYKELAAVLAEREAEFARGYPRQAKLEPRFAEALPELVLGIGKERLAELAVKAMTPKAPPVVSIDHIHMVRVSIREHALILREKLLRLGTATFRALCADCKSTLEVVARFLALLELYREGLVAFDQMVALGELTVRWTGGDQSDLELSIDEYGDEPAPEPDGVPAEAVTEEDLIEAGMAEPETGAGTAGDGEDALMRNEDLAERGAGQRDDAGEEG